METFIGIFFFVLGLIIGSFLNVVVLRHGLQSLRGRSHCPHCKTTLTVRELVPVVSFLIQRGRCRTCHTPISIQYPLVEVLTGLLFLGVYLSFGIPLDILTIVVMTLHLIIFSLLVCILVYDIHHTIIPNEFVYPFAGIALALLCTTTVAGISQFALPTRYELLAGPLLFSPFFFLWLVSRGRWLGLGDGKLALGMGWFLGVAGGFSAVLLAFWIGAVVSSMLIVFEKMGTTHLRRQGGRFTMKSEIPFAPFLLLGLALVYFFSLSVVEFFIIT